MDDSRLLNIGIHSLAFQSEDEKKKTLNIPYISYRTRGELRVRGCASGQNPQTLIDSNFLCVTLSRNMSVTVVLKHHIGRVSWQGRAAC